MADTDGAQTTVLDDFDELLKRPADAASRLLGQGSSRAAMRLLGGAFAAYALYGAVAGLFQGGAQTAVAAWKAPVIVLFSLTLCAPSLYVFASLAGADVSMRRLVVALAGFAAMLALLFVGFLPITWLFSVSSRSLGFVVWLHLAIWLVSLGFAKRLLRRVLAEESSGGVIGLWLAMLFVVSLQVTTMIRPVLWRSPERPLIESERLFFLEHFGRVLDPLRSDPVTRNGDDARTRRARRAGHGIANETEGEPLQRCAASARIFRGRQPLPARSGVPESALRESFVLAMTGLGAEKGVLIQVGHQHPLDVEIPGISRLTVKKILNHAERDVTAVYDRHSYDPEKRSALEAWGRRLEAIVSGAGTRGQLVAMASGEARERPDAAVRSLHLLSP